MDDPELISELDAASKWAEANEWLLSLVLSEFRENSKWPMMGPLQRKMMRAGSSRDVLDLAREIPRSLGFLGPDDFGNQEVVQLSIRGICQCSERGNLPDDFLACVNLVFETYVAADTDPEITRSQIEDRLGLSGERLLEVSEMLLAEGWIFAGGTGTPRDEWDRRIHDNARRLGSLRSMDEYFEVQAMLMYPETGSSPFRAGSSDPSVRNPTFGHGLASPVSFGVGELHPAIGEAVSELFEGEHYAEAVRSAAMALCDFVRQEGGFEEADGRDGTDLMGAAFGGESPVIPVGWGAPKMSRSVQQGTMLLAQGIILGVRNPLAHRRVDLQPDEAYELLSAMSLVARRIAGASGR